MNYLLIVFGKSEKQDEFVQTLCRDVSVMSDMGDVRYYYGPESVIITFQCSENLESVSSFMELLYGKMKLVYILLPYERDKLSLMMDDDVSKHLFDIETNNKKNDERMDIGSLVQKLFKENLGDDNGLTLDSNDYEIDEIDEIKKLKNLKKEPSLDELLDKINSNGISSLSKKELSLLNNYSK